MSAGSDQVRNSLQSHAKESVKQFIMYDGLGRMTAVYTANVFAQNGDVCMVTMYSYVTATSGNVQGMKEIPATWNSAWDF